MRTKQDVVDDLISVTTDHCITLKSTDDVGYVGLYLRETGSMTRAHRYVLEKKIGRSLSPDECACHTCDVRNCVNPIHLFVGSRVDNQVDRDRKNRQSKGNDVYGAKLNATLVTEIRQLYSAGGYTMRELGERFSVNPQSICNIVNHKTWRHVT